MGRMTSSVFIRHSCKTKVALIPSHWKHLPFGAESVRQTFEIPFQKNAGVCASLEEYYRVFTVVFMVINFSKRSPNSLAIKNVRCGSSATFLLILDIYQLNFCDKATYPV